MRENGRNRCALHACPIGDDFCKCPFDPAVASPLDLRKKVEGEPAAAARRRIERHPLELFGLLGLPIKITGPRPALRRGSRPVSTMALSLTLPRAPATARREMPSVPDAGASRPLR